MAIYTYKKYKISLHHDSKKTQGLRTGDIVRRQYYDDTNVVYSLMCVLSYGKEEFLDSNEEIVSRDYFIGALLEGDAPNSEQILDFVRVTNLFDTSRSGAMYLTGSDEQAPFMDVIDGIGRNASLSWPENISTPSFSDAERQYVVVGSVDSKYLQSYDGNQRVLHLTKSANIDSSAGIQQDFYKYVQNPDRVLISYKIKSSRNISCKMTLGYQDGTRTDGEETYNVTTEWQYKLHAVTIDFSGRHLRTLKLDLSSMQQNDEVWIADFNIILLSSIANYGDASKMRVGKLNGISDPVFGQLDGYGSYMQKLFASKSAHISGTLTAGDENGFASTFYAGKIHRNVFVNSIDIDFVTPVFVEKELSNPTGIGNVYRFLSNTTMNAQTNEWLLRHVGAKYTLSFWIYTESGGQISILQNNKIVGTFQIPEEKSYGWHRYGATFELQHPNEGDEMTITLASTLDIADGNIYISSPQLECGDIITQYQPTDNVLNETDEYGAWFNRGGIGGTIQNPLLRLNYDGEGSIDTSTGSILLKPDGSGHLANSNIKWTADGQVTFGKDVILSWDNIDNSIKNEFTTKYVRITGPDVFTILGDSMGGKPSANPKEIVLSLDEVNLKSTSSQRQWYYVRGNDCIAFEGENSKTLSILPFADYWGEDDSLTIRCIVIYNGETYTDTVTIQKRYMDGFYIEIVSSAGEIYKNDQCQTSLTANVYYKGILLDPQYVSDNFTFEWSKYKLPDLKNPVSGWYEEKLDSEGNVIQNAIDITKQKIELNYSISGQDCYVIEMSNSAGTIFRYAFPYIFR